MPAKLCFVLMPFGRKPDSGGLMIDFDKVYDRVIKPAIENTGMEPIRADEEQAGGIIHKPMYERLLLCEFAVADLTTANANVYYELGVRHAVRPASTILIFADTTRLPFDVAPLRGLPYKLDPTGEPDDVEATIEAISTRLKAAREVQTDSPLFELIDGMRPQQVPHEKTDAFRDQVEYSQSIKSQLRDARRAGVDEIRKIERQLGELKDTEAGVLIDLMLSYRAKKAWPEMISLVERMPRHLQSTVMVQEQYALALNRDGQGEKAETTLLELIDARGPSSETCGILGRVYKDRWTSALKEGDTYLAGGLLEKAIAAYVAGFETDPRDAYPGVNAVTLMALRDPPDERGSEFMPLVRFAVKRKMALGKPDYWDHATLVELAVLEGDERGAKAALGKALGEMREGWEAETTANNLRLVRECRERRGPVASWNREMEEKLAKAGSRH
ncbi:MAG: TRAFs-binding domain-containing protein [Pseudomonadota bacterium]|nr:TRAFs-binding domain-containing protein [Pseudomonadota bacterium]